MSTPSVDMQVKETFQKLMGTSDDVKKVMEKYLIVMARCIYDDAFRKEFENDPHDILNNYVGMKVPKDVPVILDQYEHKSPCLLVRTETSQFQYVEGPLQVVKTEYEHSGNMKKPVVYSRQESGAITIKVPVEMKDCKAMVILPYLSSETDLLTTYSFGDAKPTEIVLSCC